MTTLQKEYHSYLNSTDWKRRRQGIIDRDGGRCRLCNSTKILTVHHRLYEAVRGEEADVDLITLCRKCHDNFHGIRHLSRQAQKHHKRTPLNIIEKPYVKELSWIV